MVKLHWLVLLVSIFSIFSLSPSFGMEPEALKRSKNIHQKRHSKQGFNKKRNPSKKKQKNDLESDRCSTYLTSSDEVLYCLLRQTDPIIHHQLPFVCKQWRNVVYQDFKDFKVYDIDFAPHIKEEDPSPRIMFLAHNRANCYLELKTPEADFIPDFLKALSCSLINADCFSPFPSALLSEAYSELNPFMQSSQVQFAFKITEQSPLIQSYLWQIIDKNKFEWAKFSTLAKKRNHRKAMQKYLMSLKILALSEDENAIQEMKIFEDIAYKHLNFINRKGIDYYTSATAQSPFWGAYTVKTKEKSALRAQFSNLKYLLCSGKINESDVLRIKAFAKYALMVDPSIPEESQKNLQEAFTQNAILQGAMYKLGF